MKKLLMLSSVAVLAFSLFAQEEEVAPKSEEKQQTTKKLSSVWPAYFAVCQWPQSGDVVGLRLTIPFSTAQENVTGVDLGFWGRSLSFEGLQLNLLRNDAFDSVAGLQAGLYNSIGRGELLGVQVGLWNEAVTFRGCQVGLVNVVGEAQGFQFGLINRAETLYGYQVGLVNVIRSSEVPFFPFVNVGF